MLQIQAVPKDNIPGKSEDRASKEWVCNSRQDGRVVGTGFTPRVPIAIVTEKIRELRTDRGK